MYSVWFCRLATNTKHKRNHLPHLSYRLSFCKKIDLTLLLRRKSQQTISKLENPNFSIILLNRSTKDLRDAYTLDEIFFPNKNVASLLEMKVEMNKTIWHYIQQFSLRGNYGNNDRPLYETTVISHVWQYRIVQRLWNYISCVFGHVQLFS